MRAIPLGRIAKQFWIPVVLIVVLAVSGLVVLRLHKMFASQDLNANAGAAGRPSARVGEPASRHPGTG